MKNLTKRISALLVFLAAGVITILCMGISAFSEDLEADSIGWCFHYYYNEWFYYNEVNTAVKAQDYKVDGILYSFDDKGICTGKKSGLVKEYGIQRRYSEGLPYTGWTTNKDGLRKYYLDGYAVTGDFRIGKKIYSFDKNGIYTGKSTKPVLTANCIDTISSDTDIIKITVSAADKTGTEYITGDPHKMERWENGKWINCIGENVEYAVNDLGYIFSSQNSNTVSFYPQQYTDNEFTEGYYRITLSCWEDGKYNTTKQEFYAVFEVVPPVEIKMSEERYLYTGDRYTETEAEVIINSSKLKGKQLLPIMYGYDCEDGYWICIHEFTDDNIEFINENKFKIYYKINFEHYKYWNCFKFALDIDGTEYSETFRIEHLRADAEASLENRDIIVAVDINNTYYKPITIDTGTFKLYNTGENNVSGARIADSKPAYKTLNPGEKITLRYTLSDFYDISKLKDNFLQYYTFRIDGVGDVEFRLEEDDISAYLKYKKLKGIQKT